MKRIHPIEEEVEMAKARLTELQIELKKLNSIRSVLGKELETRRLWRIRFCVAHEDLYPLRIYCHLCTR